MAEAVTSPRRTLTPDERKNQGIKPKSEIREFADILKALVQIFNALVILNSKFGKTGKGAQLRWTVVVDEQQPDGTVRKVESKVSFNRKHLRSANSRGV